MTNLYGLYRFVPFAFGGCPLVNIYGPPDATLAFFRPGVAYHCVQHDWKCHSHSYRVGEIGGQSPNEKENKNRIERTKIGMSACLELRYYIVESKYFSFQRVICFFNNTEWGKEKSSSNQVSNCSMTNVVLIAMIILRLISCNVVDICKLIWHWVFYQLKL